MANWKFHIETYGCKVNQYESQALREAWQRADGVETDRPEHADYILINSCAITGRAERNARNAVFRLKKSSPDAKIILTGCAAQFYGGFTPRKNANWAMPDICVPQSAKRSLLRGPEKIETASGAIHFSAIQSYRRARPVVKIQDGCSQNCAYCIVPQTRGRPRGRAAAEILAECRQLAAQGYGELVLSGVNLRQYPGGFWKLLAWLDSGLAPEYADRLRLRLSSIDPAMLNEAGLETLACCRLICPHLHLSLQHASPNVLAGMGRRHYNGEFVKKAIAAVSGIWPMFGLGADILVGFPGESEDDFRMLLDFIAEIPFTYAHVFPYSRRQGTLARDFPAQLSKSEKERRAWLVRETVNSKTRFFLQKQLALPKVTVAPELTRENRPRGVNEFYTTCFFTAAVPNSHGLAACAPVGLAENSLQVELRTDLSCRKSPCAGSSLLGL